MVYYLYLVLSINLVFLHAREEKPLKRNDFGQNKNFSFIKNGLDKLLDIMKKRPGLSVGSPRKNSDIQRTSAELIVSRGFESQEHTVVTEDGYKLGLYRIMNKYNVTKLKPVVLLWHQFISNSNLWLISSPGSLNRRGRYSELKGQLVNNCNNNLTSNLAFTLAACGYDVWLGNYRGNRFSLGHSYLETIGPKFSNYTFTELGIYDIKNTIEYIMENTTKESIAYIGSSEGTTCMLALLSLRPRFEKHLKPIILMPPVAFRGHTTSVALRLLAPLVPIFINFKLGVGIPLFIAEILSESCLFPILGSICNMAIQSAVSNETSPLTDKRTYAVYVSVLGDNYVSTNVLYQTGQFITSGRFSQFDYLDSDLNNKAYGQSRAPDYPLRKIRSRNLVLIRGPNDSFAVEKDVDKLMRSLKFPPKEVIVVNDSLYQHLDFVLSKNNNELINRRILYHLSG